MWTNIAYDDSKPVKHACSTTYNHEYSTMIIYSAL